jgi:hypothetical protein
LVVAILAAAHTPEYLLGPAEAGIVGTLLAEEGSSGRRSSLVVGNKPGAVADSEDTDMAVLVGSLQLVDTAVGDRSFAEDTLEHWGSLVARSSLAGGDRMLVLSRAVDMAVEAADIDWDIG